MHQRALLASAALEKSYDVTAFGASYQLYVETQRNTAGFG
jgi:hypothetical protein